MRATDYIRTIPNRKAERKIFRGIIYFGGRISSSNGPFYASMKFKYDKPSEGKMYSADGNRIDVDIKEIAELDFKAKQYISNRRSYTIGVDELKKALKKCTYDYIKCSGYSFSVASLKKLLEAAEILDIDAYNISSYKDIPCLVGVSQIEQNVAITASMATGREYKNEIDFENLKNNE